MIILSDAEARIVGALIEKENTTPDYYPLTLNGIMIACNQKSNREPVVQYNEHFIEENLEKLWDKKLVCRVTSTEMRVPKFRQNFTTALALSKPETALICVLLLRGPQTVGELRSRTARLYDFQELSAVDDVLQNLINSEEPKVIKLPRSPGKDPRYAHLFCGIPQFEEQPVVIIKNDKERIVELENEVQFLKEAISDLQTQFADFKKQFE